MLALYIVSRIWFFKELTYIERNKLKSHYILFLFEDSEDSSVFSVSLGYNYENQLLLFFICASESLLLRV